MKNLLLTLFLLFAQVSFGQTKNEFYLAYGISNAVPMYGIRNNIDGAPGYSGKGTSSFGFRFLLQSKKAVRLETGADYMTCKFEVSPNLPPGVDETPHTEEVSLISIPIYANLTFLKYCFVQGGVLGDFEISRNATIQKQTGLGFGLGLGGKYAYKNVEFMINPFLQRHALITFKDEQGSRQSLINAAVRFAVGYSF